MTQGYGDFGSVSKAYDEARQGFPEGVIQYFWTFIEDSSPIVLDVGCGTGIATRQLVKPGVRIFGSDKDAAMIKIAKEKGPREITYVVAQTDNLPFKDEQFSAITAFSAFHWFSDKESISEVRRILKKGGLFFVANKNDVGNFKKGYKTVLNPFIRGELPNIKRNYSPVDIFRENSFAAIEERHFSTSECFTFSQAVSYPQSMSIWNLVPEIKRQEAYGAIEKYCEKKLEGEKIERGLDILVVAGKK
jgi:ubiquinone/menaquinone biosynthesis C-methylase UbiE